MLQQIDNCNNDEEKNRIMQHMKQFDSNVKSYLAQQKEIQAKKLKEAIEARKAMRESKSKFLSSEKEHQMIPVIKRKSGIRVETLNESVIISEQTPSEAQADNMTEQVRSDDSFEKLPRRKRIQVQFRTE